MPRGDKGSYTDKQKRQAEHIEEGYEKKGVSKDEAEKQLVELRNEGLAQFDVDENGTPVYRVDPGAIAARKNKGW